MHKLDLPINLKEAAAIERRRNMEHQRQSRIFNAKYRYMGVDVPTLQRQVQERRALEAQERSRNEAFDADRQYCAKVAMILENRDNDMARDLDKAMQRFRDDHQQHKDSRDFDLFDPDALKKDRPARVCDNDPRCGPSSMQRFAGEDLSGKEREKLQKTLFGGWLKEQKDERKRLEAQRDLADDIMSKKRMELDRRAQYLGQMEDAGRRAMNIAMSNYNQALAQEAAEHRKLQKNQEEDNNLMEIYNNLTGDMLTENPEMAASSFGPHRVVTDRWKGMTPEEVEDILKIRGQQKLERERLEDEERLRDEEWVRQRTIAAHAAINMEKQEEQLSREIRKRMDQYNHQLSREQRAHLEYMNNVVYTNNPTAHYHSQFNTSSR